MLVANIGLTTTGDPEPPRAAAMLAPSDDWKYRT